MKKFNNDEAHEMIQAIKLGVKNEKISSISAGSLLALIANNMESDDMGEIKKIEQIKSALIRDYRDRMSLKYADGFHSANQNDTNDFLLEQIAELKHEINKMNQNVSDPIITRITDDNKREIFLKHYKELCLRYGVYISFMTKNCQDVSLDDLENHLNDLGIEHLNDTIDYLN